MRWNEERIADQGGRTFLITGANSGLGFEMSRALVAKGARVIMAVRSAEKGRAARAKLPRPELAEVRTVDLADLDTVRRLAGDLRRDQVDIDVLVNNAGVMMPPRTLSAQGHELQFAANHLGHFALTGLLLDRVADRVVTVSSTLHRPGKIHYDDLDGAGSYSPTRYYSQSKFANVLFGLELDRRLRAAGSPVRSLLAHPGYSATNLQTSGPTGIMKAFMRVGNAVMAQSAARGALSQLYAAVDPDARSGQFIGPDGIGEHRGWPTVVQPVDAAKDPADAQRLWTLSEQLTGVQFAVARSR
ncbi:SDR family NAD(P)-dependent oxidoreductase [Dactylosporangium aurantiacum]|uniref:SDR family NAD(P)-dependent oxidoreductase n=1 Tax=Dactylosporangium aurantiacum TaxID=35754 RepID=A0A9Q9MGB1_9ACTN|nr:oxidoreductase [Dactylosporangium aurantiacum]MDG6100528.1 oxidoreductase [Dactylosporangium aurantiacum]UWZ55374.1 SDR family NAD(P)-dependent oxidoreductase [Dactylosporangium aurantiacum]